MRHPLLVLLLGASFGCSDNGLKTSPTPAAPAADAGADGDDAGAAIERKITMVFAAPDLPPQFVCLGGFAPDAEGTAQGAPVRARGPFGVFDGSDGAHLALKAGFPYGAVVPLAIRARDAEFFDTLAPVGYLVDDVQPRRFAGAGVDSDACKNAYPTARDVPWRKLAFKRGALGVGQSWLAAVTGCQSASSDPACAGGGNLRLVSSQLDTSPPTVFSGVGDVRIGVQLADLSPFAAYQNIDVYVQPLRASASGAGGEGGTLSMPDGPPLRLGDGSRGTSWGDVTGASSGLQLPVADTATAALAIVPHGQSPCFGAMGCGSTTTIILPIAPFLSRYAAPTGGATGAAWSGNQVFALFGRVPLGPDESASSVVRLGVFSANVP